MAKYHKYVFDLENRKFVGDFENMYKQEFAENFDSWHQSDSRQLNRKIVLSMLEDYNFGNILDLGCGKGALTHLLKKNNNYVKGVDISETAVSIAKENYADIDFCCGNVLREGDLKRIIDNKKYDLVFTSELLSYLDNYQELLCRLSFCTEYLLASLYIPEDPIGFVKSNEDLLQAIKKNYDIVESVILNVSNFIIVFARSKNLEGKKDE